MRVTVQLAGMAADRLLKAARAAEELGYAGVYVPDHFLDEPPGTETLSDTVRMPEAMTSMAGIAAVTSRVEVGAHVICNLFRHPVVTAQSMATVDQLSGGRALLGLGTGWIRNEFRMTGIPYPDIKVRLRMLDEALQVIESLWNEPRTTFHGEFYRLDDAFLTVKPVQKHMPVLLGGSGKGLLRIAARRADIVNVIADLGRAGTAHVEEIAKLTEDVYRAKLDFVRDEAEACGREVTLSSTVFVIEVAENDAQVEQTLEGFAAGFGVTPDLVRGMPMAIIGTAEQCAEEIHRRERDWGIEHLVVSAGSGPESIERFGRHVLPLL